MDKKKKNLIMDLAVGAVFIIAYLVIALIWGGTIEFWISLLGGLVVILGTVYLVMQFKKLMKIGNGTIGTGASESDRI